MDYATALPLVRDLLFPEDGRVNWVQEHTALTADGEMIETDSPEAVRFCLAGAVERVVGDITGERDGSVPGEITAQLVHAIEDMGFDGRYERYYDTPGTQIDNLMKVIRFNDSEYTNPRDVREVLDRAIAG